jgi:PASTA domain
VRVVRRAAHALVLALPGLLLVACTSSQVDRADQRLRDSPPSSPSTAVSAAHVWPKHAPVVGAVRAPEPPADDIRLFEPMLLAAYRQACSNVVSVESEIRALGPRSRMIFVRCSGQRIKAVRLVFTGVVVPRLGGQQLAMQEPQSLLAMLGLHWQITQRRARDSEESNTVVEQHPAPGLVVPFGTTVRVVIAR